MESEINKLSVALIKKLHRKFKYADCNRSAKAYYDSARLVKQETEKFLKEIKSSKTI